MKDKLESVPNAPLLQTSPPNKHNPSTEHGIQDSLPIRKSLRISNHDENNKLIYDNLYVSNVSTDIRLRDAENTCLSEVKVKIITHKEDEFFPIELLPEEILDMIFSYLSYQDIKNIKITNKFFLNMMGKYMFLIRSDFKYHFPNIVPADSPYAHKVFKNYGKLLCGDSNINELLKEVNNKTESKWFPYHAFNVVSHSLNTNELEIIKDKEIVCTNESIIGVGDIFVAVKRMKFSPNGQFLIFIANKSINVVPIDNGKCGEVVDMEFEDTMVSFVISSNNCYIAASTITCTYIININNTKLGILEAITVQNVSILGTISKFSPDCSFLFVMHYEEFAGHHKTKQSFITIVKRESEKKWTVQKVIETDGWVFCPCFSNDSTRVVICSYILKFQI